MNKPLENKIALIIEIIVLNISFTWWYTDRTFEPLLALFPAIGAIIYTLFFTGKEKEEDLQQQISPKKRKIVVALISLSILGLLAGVYFDDNDTPMVKITNPSNKEKVNIETDIKGITKNLDTEYRVWIVIYDDNEKKYFPHTHQTTLPNSDNSTWESSSVTVGTSQDINREFEIYAVAFKQNDKFSIAMNNYFSKTDRDGILPQNFPKFEYSDKVTVTLK